MSTRVTVRRPTRERYERAALRARSRSYGADWVGDRFGAWVVIALLAVCTGLALYDLGLMLTRLR